MGLQGNYIEKRENVKKNFEKNKKKTRPRYFTRTCCLSFPLIQSIRKILVL